MNKFRTLKFKIKLIKSHVELLKLLLFVNKYKKKLHSNLNKKF